MRLKTYQARGIWNMQRLQYFNKAGAGEGEGVLEKDAVLYNVIRAFLLVG